MNFSFVHQNFNVLDLKRSLAFYEEALNLKEKHRFTAPDGSFTLVYLGDEEGNFELELTEVHGRTTPYDLGEGEFHLAFATKDFEAAKRKHQEMQCIVLENEELNIYFIADPDGYWLEVVPFGMKL